MTAPHPPEAVGLLADTVRNVQRSIADVQAMLDALDPKPAERLVTPAEMEVGGWVRFPGTHAWRQIDSINIGHPSETCIHYRFGGVVYSVPVNPWDTLPYHTDAEFQAICDARQAEEDRADDQLHFAEWQADR